MPPTGHHGNSTLFHCDFRCVKQKFDSLITKEEVMISMRKAQQSIISLKRKTAHIVCTNTNSSSCRSLTPIHTAHFRAGTIPSSVSINGLSNSNVDTAADFSCADVNLFDEMAADVAPLQGL